MNWIVEYNKSNNDEYQNYKLTGKYLSVYRPNHPKAMSNGYVYIHQLQAEKILGRYLYSNECVHHKDEDKLNNSLDNLMIFASIGDHTAFHNGAEIYCVDNVWYSKFIANKYIICPICGKNYMYLGSNMCNSCYLDYKHKNSKIPKYYDLFNLITEYPMTKIGEIYNVSDKTVVKWCKYYDLPSNYNNIKAMREKRKTCIIPIEFV